jgi:hypothetical protein
MEQNTGEKDWGGGLLMMRVLATFFISPARSKPFFSMRAHRIYTVFRSGARVFRGGFAAVAARDHALSLDFMHFTSHLLSLSLSF